MQAEAALLKFELSRRVPGATALRPGFAALPPEHVLLVGTDLELVFTRSRDDTVVHVNKAGVMICRIKLQKAHARDAAGAADAVLDLCS